MNGMEDSTGIAQVAGVIKGFFTLEIDGVEEPVYLIGAKMYLPANKYSEVIFFSPCFCDTSVYPICGSLLSISNSPHTASPGNKIRSLALRCLEAAPLPRHRGFAG
jgi:hypothetical protein